MTPVTGETGRQAAPKPCPQAAGGDCCVFPRCDCPGGEHAVRRETAPIAPKDAVDGRQRS